MFIRTLGSHLMRRNILRLGLVALVLAGALLAGSLLRTPPRAHASGGCGYLFTATATPANSLDGFTRLDNACLDNTPGAIVIVTHNVNPGGSATVFLDNHPFGVFYSAPYWYIFHEDDTPILPGDNFNVLWDKLAYDGGTYGVFVQAATSANSFSDYTTIDAPSLDNQPNRRLLVTPNWNPGGAPGVYNNHPIGVFYDTYTGHWCIFNEDRAPIQPGTFFNVKF